MLIGGVMPTRVREKTYYSTNEAAQRIGVSRQTLLRWFHEGKVADVKRDRRNWRIFSEEDIDRIRKWAASADDDKD